MQSLSRDDAKALVMEWCTDEPQPDELYFVWTTGSRYPEIWVAQRRTTYHRYVFEVHKSASIKEHPNGIEIVDRMRIEQTMITYASWKALRKESFVVYKGQRIRK
jgi:hypothetical protein